jgi:serine/threonine protein kinase
MTEAAALDLMAQLLEIMGYLHAQKPPVVHRDVKPTNIVVDLETGKVSLIDLGIARLSEGGLDGDTQGTREFAPPEQYGFMPTTPRADVYAAGKVLLWMLEGREEPLPRGLKRLIRRMTAPENRV